MANPVVDLLVVAHDAQSESEKALIPKLRILKRIGKSLVSLLCILKFYGQQIDLSVLVLSYVMHCLTPILILDCFKIRILVLLFLKFLL